MNDEQRKNADRYARFVSLLDVVIGATGWHSTGARGYRLADDWLQSKERPETFSLWQRVWLEVRGAAFCAELLAGVIVGLPLWLFMNRR